MDDLIFEALGALARRQTKYRLYRRYYDGNHNLVVPNIKLDSAFGKMLRDLRDNLCEVVVDSMVNRLVIDGWTAPDEYRDAIAAIEKRSSFARVQGEMATEFAITGDGYVLVWPGRDGKVREHAQRADQCIVIYDVEDPTLRILAVKTWVERRHVRVNAYWPGRTERYVAVKAGTKMPRKASDLRLLDEDGIVDNPWGEVPLFHAANNAPVGSPGRSELSNVIPLQDMLNKSIADLMVAGEAQALPVRALIGAGEIKDPRTGQTVEPELSPGSILKLPKDAKLDQFDAADLAGFLAEQESFRREIGTVSGTPLYMLNLLDGALPSGESLKTADRPLTDKVGDRQLCLTDAWRGARRLAVRMELGMRDYEDLDIDPVWRPAETQSEASRLANAETKLRVGYPRRQVLEDLGHSPETAVNLIAEADAEADAAADRAARRFDAGLV